MNETIRRIKVIFWKEFIDQSKNPSIYILCLFPLLNAQMYSMMDIKSENLGISMAVCLNMAVVMITTAVIGILIAEEKDKNTLKTLMLAGVTPSEFIIGKGLFTFLLISIINLCVFLLLRISANYALVFLGLGVLMSFLMILIGAIIGLFASNQTQVGIMATPILALFFMVPTLSLLGIDIEIYAQVLPTYQVSNILTDMVRGGHIGDNLIGFGVIGVWILCTYIIFVRLFRFRKFT